MAGSSSYPETVDNKTQLQDGVDYMEADNVNNAYVPINVTQTFIGANGKGASWSTDILEYLANTKAPIITKASGSTLSVSAGVVFIKNSGQSHRLMRRNTNAVTVTASDLDTGSMANNTFYYIYAVADTAATTFTVKFSTSATSPTGLTNFELIGWFYNQAGGALDVTLPYVGNVKAGGRDVPNAVTITSTADVTVTATATFELLANTTVKIRTSGRPVLILFQTYGYIVSSTGAFLQSIKLREDGSTLDDTQCAWPNQDQTGNDQRSGQLSWIREPAAGEHTYEIWWIVPNGGTGHSTKRQIKVIEL